MPVDFTPPGAVTDNPDFRDYRASHILGSCNTLQAISFEKDFSLLCIPAHDQKTTMHCSAYSLTHKFEILNTIEFRMAKEIQPAETVVFNPEEQWGNQKKTGATESGGDSLQNALNALKKNGLTYKGKKLTIQGYALVKNSELQKYIKLGYPIYTGTPVTKTNYNNAGRTGIYTGKDGQIIGGHAICLTGWKTINGELYFEALNSYGPKWGFYKNGTFLIPEKQLSSLYSCYIVYDTKDFQNLKAIFRDVSDQSEYAEQIKWVVDNGLMTGYDESLPMEERFFKPDQPLSRMELVLVLNRFYNKFIKK